MAETNVDGMMALSKLLEEGHADELRLMLASALRKFMDAQVAELCNAPYGARTEARVNSRNGYRERPLETRLGTVDLSIPKLRSGTYMPSFIEPRRRWEKAFVNVVCEAYVHGVSTRKVEALVEAMGAKGMSKSTVSRMAAELDEQVQQFRERRLSATAYPYMWLDALYIKVREAARVVSKAVLVAHGVSEDGSREVLGVAVADGEMEHAWRSFLAGLVERGLRGVQLVISDAHAGLAAARRGVFNGTSWQRCRVHFMRNLLTHVKHKVAQGAVNATVKAIFAQPTYDAALVALHQAIDLLRPKHPTVAAFLEAGGEDALTYMTFPEKHWRQIHSTNPLERLNREIRRRTDVVGIFPNNASALRLITMLLIEQNDEWAVGRRYFSKESMAALRKPDLEQPARLEEAA